MDNNNQNGGFNPGFYDPNQQQFGQTPQGMPYGQNQQFQPNQPYGQAPQGAPYGQNPQFQQGTPYGQNPQFQQSMPQGMPQGMPYGQASPAAPSKTSKNGGNKAGLIIGIILGVLLLIGGGVFATLKILESKGAKDSEAVVKEFFASYEKQSLDDMYATFHPDIRDDAKEQTMSNFGNGSGAATEAEYWEFMNSYFGGFNVDYTIEKQKKLKGSELNDVLDATNTAFGTSIKAKNVYAFKINETYSGTNGKQVQEETVVVAKCDGKWYIIAASTDKVISSDVTTPTTEAVTTEEPTTEEATTEEPTTEEAATEEATTEAGNTDVTINADGFDWEHMQFSCNGKSFNLKGMTYADIEAMGYTIDDSYLSEELEDNQYTLSERAEAADESDIYVRFKNFTGGGKKAVRDCEILGVKLSRDSWHNTYDAALGNGVTFGMTIDEVKAIMGEPSYEYVSDDGTFMSVDYEESDEVYADKVSFNFNDGALIDIELESYK